MHLPDIFRLDYVSCVLTISSTVLVGRKLWQGWAVAAINSLLICFIGLKTAQVGFVPANLFCIVLYARNVWAWRASSAFHQRSREHEANCG